MLLTWQDFENTCENNTVDFEHLCRIFFKYHYIKDATVILNQKANNPGIETEPILIDGKRVGFQAKYFSNNVNYTDIFNSAQKVVKYYGGKIDKVVLFCNKDVSIDAENYINAVSLLSDNNIEIESCCNNSILDTINTISEYAPIKCLFFNKLNLSDEWFKEKLDRSLKELEPRYTPGLHVNEFKSQKHFDILYRNEQVLQYLQALIGDAKKELKFNEQVLFKERLEKIIDSLVIPDRHDYGEILSWYEQFTSVENEINQAIGKLENRLVQIDSTDERRKVYNELNQLKRLLEIIRRFDLAKDEHFRYINNNVLIVEGDAGNGKSHLLGYEAEVHGISNKYRSVLLLGQKFICEKTPQEQIMQILDLESNFHDFLLACEAKGELDGGITVIMIDAVNECEKYGIWKQYINDIIEEVTGLKFVRLVCSIRTTYKKYFFTHKIQEAIEQHTISLVEVTGFRNNLLEAVPLFFNYYKIPITTAAFFESEFENPLFLQTYCEAYSEGIGIGSRGIFALYNAYMEKEENKVRDLYCITNGIPFARKIMEKIGKYLFDNNTNRMPLISLYSECNSIPECDKFIDSFLKAKVLVQYNYDSDEYIYINYERFADYIVAKHILDNTNNYDELCVWIQQNLLVTNEKGIFVRSYVEGQFAALSVLAYEKYNKEIIDCLRVLPDTNVLSLYLRNCIVTEYLDAYQYRADKDIDADNFYNVVAPYIQSVDSEIKHLDILIGLAGRNCSLNINETTKFLMKMPLKVRDYTWTIYINDKYTQGERVFNTVQYFLNANIGHVTHNERLLYGQLLTWFLSSSNRELRDKGSRALIRLIKNDILAIYKLLSIFSEVNDPYIISRLYGCAYGALLQTDERMLNVDELSLLCREIYELVFNQEIVFPDIMLRDYALNIIEFCNTKQVKLDFEIESCRPPYKSFEIPSVDSEELEKKYPKRDDNWLGTSAIKYSMMPDHKITGFPYVYGDFGRYVFQSALNGFKDVNIECAFKYAYSYIVNELGYDNDLFSEYDKHIGYGRGRNNCYIERIGKKYEWIAMYHVLALVSDSCELNDEYYNVRKTYKGTWSPYIRDFDPTLTISNDNHPHKGLGVKINRKEYNNWQLSNDDWTRIDDASNLIDQVRVVDNHGEVWYALFFTTSDASGKDFDKARQSVWQTSTACLINKSERENFVSSIKNRSFYGRWFIPAEVDSRYNVFAREYVWSPAYADEYGENNFIEAKIEMGKKKVLKSMPRVKYIGKNNGDYTNNDLDFENMDDLKFEEITEEVEVDESVMERIGTILPCYHLYLWEEEYDYSKDDVINISMPNGRIVNALKLTQTLDGIWERDGEIVCADFRLIEDSNVDGLYIKEKYLRELLGDNLSIVWIGMGEKQHTYGMIGVGKQSFCELSSLIYEDDLKNIKEISKVNHR